MAREDGDADSNLSYVYSNRTGTIVAEISSHSIKRLQPSKYLNDEVIQFYLAYLVNDLCSNDLVKKIHVFDNFFHNLLTETFKDPPEVDDRNEKIENRIDTAKWRSLDRWFIGTDIFEKDFLIFPVCKDEHWFAIIVCYPSEVRDWDTIQPSPATNGESRVRPMPGIIVLDSLGIKATSATRRVRDFLDFEWRTRATVIKSFHQHNLPEYHPKLPKQTNAYDCGIFMLAYLQAFIKNSDKFYRHVRKCRDGGSESLDELVNSALAECSRESIRNLITRKCEFKRHASKHDD